MKSSSKACCCPPKGSTSTANTQGKTYGHFQPGHQFKNWIQTYDRPTHSGRRHSRLRKGEVGEVVGVTTNTKGETWLGFKSEKKPDRVSWAPASINGEKVVSTVHDPTGAVQKLQGKRHI